MSDNVKRLCRDAFIKGGLSAMGTDYLYYNDKEIVDIEFEKYWETVLEGE